MKKHPSILPSCFALLKEIVFGLLQRYYSLWTDGMKMVFILFNAAAENGNVALFNIFIGGYHDLKISVMQKQHLLYAI